MTAADADESFPGQRIVVALGGNALLKRGDEMSYENQLANVQLACDRLANLAPANELVISHGNGPQIGLLALESDAYKAVPPYPLDVLGAESQGMIGYMIERELRARLSPQARVGVLLTTIEVDLDDPTFNDPSKPIGPLYSEAEIGQLKLDKGWTFRPDGDSWRRVVPSPSPHHIVEIELIEALVDAGCTVICAGGGGVPAARGDDGSLRGIEAVIDKDRASALLARLLDADLLILATDAKGAYLGFGTPEQRLLREANPDAILERHRHEFAPGSMLPKVEAACEFAKLTGRAAVIGDLENIEHLVEGTAGTRITTEASGVKTT